MNSLRFITLMLIANIALAVFVILKTRKLPFHPDTKVLIYVVAVCTPIFEFILYLVKSRKLTKA